MLVEGQVDQRRGGESLTAEGALNKKLLQCCGRCGSGQGEGEELRVEKY